MADRLPPPPIQRAPRYDKTSPYEIIETAERHNICDYSWMLNIATCATSLCTLLVVIVFFIWAGTRGVLLNN